ncbi:metal-sensing transcriptional repressor [Synechococcus sp. H65.1]|uniref:metal-sensing transcriptional repressor n=1 Tax=unclassified Synechococcus TaxID=2626047 RepID=UPI0039C10F18
MTDPIPPLQTGSTPPPPGEPDWEEEWELALERPPLSGRAQPHRHTPQSRRKLIHRLARIEGHVRGIRAMIEEDQPCPDVLLQIAAVKGALDRLARLILNDHIRHCIRHAVESGNLEVELEELQRALDHYLS